MAYETKNVLSLDSKDAMDFFLKSEQYHGFELPEYFVFDELLQNVKRIVEDTPYEECLQNGISPENLSNVNLDILLNKDGHYAVRPIVLANPFLYYFLVREICNESSWILIKKQVLILMDGKIVSEKSWPPKSPSNLMRQIYLMSVKFNQRNFLL